MENKENGGIKFCDFKIWFIKWVFKFFIGIGIIRRGIVEVLCYVIKGD